MVTILPALEQVRKDLAGLLERTAVEQVCRELGYTWRDRQLDPYTTLHLFILQVLHGNTAMTHLPHLAGKRFTASAYCQARQRLPLAFFAAVVNAFTRRLMDSGQSGDEAGRWRGHRVGLVDGSGFSMPDTPELQAYFGQPGAQQPGCGFPVAHLLALVDAEKGFLHDPIVSPLRTHDLVHAADLHPKLSAGDIVVADRGFCSFAHLALISQAKLHAVLRVHQRQIVDFHPHRPCAPDVLGKGIPSSRWVRRLGHCDQLVEWRRPKARPKWMTAEQFAALPEKLLVREIKWRLRVPGCRVQEVTLVTTLLDAERYPAKEIAALYGLRWQVEVDLRDLKITLGLDVLKGHKVETVLKEVQVYVLVYNLVRLVTVKAARRQRVAPHRISFIDALRWLQPPKPARPLPVLLENPIRPGRIEPRCIKRRMKTYKLMNLPRRELRKRLKKRRDAA
jgi:hypothetical protein